MEMNLSQKLITAGLFLLLICSLLLLASAGRVSNSTETTIEVESGFTLVNFNDLVVDNQYYGSIQDFSFDGTNVSFTQVEYTLFILPWIAGFVLLIVGLFVLIIGVISNAW